MIIIIVMMVILMIMMTKNIQISLVLSKNVPILGTFTWWKKGQKIWAWVLGKPPPSFQTMTERKRVFTYHVFPNVILVNGMHWRSIGNVRTVQWLLEAPLEGWHFIDPRGGRRRSLKMDWHGRQPFQNTRISHSNATQLPMFVQGTQGRLLIQPQILVATKSKDNKKG